MAKYTMISQYGNEIKRVDSERERDELKELGFRELKPKVKADKTKNSTKE